MSNRWAFVSYFTAYVVGYIIYSASMDQKADFRIVVLVCIGYAAFFIIKAIETRKGAP